MSRPAKLKSQSVYQYLHDRILSGNLSKGDPLPSESALAGKFGVSRFTVRRGLSKLSDKGLASSLPSRGWQVGPGEAPMARRPGTKAVRVVFLGRASQDSSTIFEGLQDVLPAAEAQLLYVPMAKPISRGELLSQMERYDADAVLFFSDTKVSHEVAASGHAGSLPMACIGYQDHLSCDTICTDFADGSRQVVEAFTKAGHRRLLMVANETLSKESPSFAARVDGFRRAAAANDCQARVVYMLSHDFYKPEGRRRLMDALRTDDGGQVTGIFAHFANFPELVSEVLVSEGLRVPEDISLAGPGHGGRVRPIASGYSALVSIDEDWREIGRCAGLRISARLRHPGLKPSLTLVPQLLVRGDSILPTSLP